MTIPNPPANGTYERPRGRTRLITRVKGDPHIDNAVQETDVRRGLCRGLAEYLEQLSLDVDGGRRVFFKAVHEEWAEPEENAAYPSAAVYPQGPGTYEARSLTPVVNPQQRVPAPDGRYLVIPSEYKVSLAVEVWATDPEERGALTRMLEAAFNPVPWRYGFVLELPHYFNVRAAYSLDASNIPDSAEDALRRYRRITFSLTAQAPLVMLYSFPNMKPMFDLQAVDSDVDVVEITQTS